MEIADMAPFDHGSAGLVVVTRSPTGRLGCVRRYTNLSHGL